MVYLKPCTHLERLASCNTMISFVSIIIGVLNTLLISLGAIRDDYVLGGE